MPDKITVLIVDDSALMRKILTTLFEGAPDIEVVGTAPNPLIAREKIKKLNPDVLTLDVEMPELDGIRFLEKIMTLRPMPVVMVSSLTERSAAVTLQALELGAVDFVTKPSGNLETNMVLLSEELISKVRTAASTRVKHRQRAPRKLAPKIANFETTETVLAFGASTGGVEVLGRLLQQFPSTAPGTVITQHMPPKFTQQFADRLNSICAVQIEEARDRERIRPGRVWIAPGDKHLTVARSGADYICRLVEGPPVSGHVPSVDVLFQSVAKSCGQNAVGVILTGMGKDGADGLLQMRRAGAATVGQDEKSSVVYGMPKAAFENGAVEQQLPEEAILETVMRLARRKSDAIRI